MSKFTVRKRKWPFHPPLQRPWELIRNSDGKPVGFFKSEEEAEEVKAVAEKGGEHGLTVDKVIKEIHRMQGQ